MAKKQVIINETAAAAAPARVAKPRAPRVKAAQHSTKVTPAEPVASAPLAAITAAENPHDVIAKIAYRLWEARGSESGSELEDWLRAEQEYRELTATV